MPPPSPPQPPPQPPKLQPPPPPPSPLFPLLANPWASYKPGAVAPASLAPTASTSRPNPRPQQQGFKGLGKGLGTIDWNGEDIIPARKDFAIDHPNIASRTKEDCDNMRLQHGIIAERLDKPGGDIPGPVDTFEHMAFGDSFTQRLPRPAAAPPPPAAPQTPQTTGTLASLCGAFPLGMRRCAMRGVLPWIQQTEINPPDSHHHHRHHHPPP